MPSNAGEDILEFTPEFDIEAGAEHFSISGDEGHAQSNTSKDRSCKRSLENPSPVGVVKQARSVQPHAEVAPGLSSLSSAVGDSLTSDVAVVKNKKTKNKKKCNKKSSHTSPDSTCAVLTDFCHDTTGTLISVDFVSAGEKAVYSIPSSQCSSSGPVCKVNTSISPSCALRALSVCTWNINGLKQKNAASLNGLTIFSKIMIWCS